MTDPRTPDELPYSAELIAAAVRRIGAAIQPQMKLHIEHHRAPRHWTADVPGTDDSGHGTTLIAALLSLADRLPAARPKP